MIKNFDRLARLETTGVMNHPLPAYTVYIDGTKPLFREPQQACLSGVAKKDVVKELLQQAEKNVMNQTYFRPATPGENFWLRFPSFLGTGLVWVIAACLSIPVVLLAGWGIFAIVVALSAPLWAWVFLFLILNANQK